MSRIVGSTSDPGMNDQTTIRIEQSTDAAAIRAVHIGYVLQTSGLLPFLPARENLITMEESEFTAFTVSQEEKEATP